MGCRPLCPRRAGPADAAGADRRAIWSRRGCRRGPRRSCPRRRSSWSTAARRLLSEPLPAAAIDWATALTATALARRRSPIRGCIRRSTACSHAIEAAPSASGWGAALVRYELLLLAELGFGLDLETLRGQRERTTISSRSARDRAGRSAPPRPSPMPASCCRCRASFARAARPTGATSSTGWRSPAIS